MSQETQEALVSNYSWLLAPGDYMQADYDTPTRVRKWLHASPIPISLLPLEDVATVTDDERKAYGQWLAQLLETKLGIELVKLYKAPAPADQPQWPVTLRDDAIRELRKYFSRNKAESESCE
jgi:hypothetical protein